jgi:hypothetical protein
MVAMATAGWTLTCQLALPQLGQKHVGIDNKKKLGIIGTIITGEHCVVLDVDAHT